MEAVPRLPMLSFELKISPVCPDFAQPFKKLINKFYGENGDLYDREIIELENLRNSACRAARDFTGCSILKRYYCQIYSLYNRFAAFEPNIGVQCLWADIYSGQTTIGDLNFELACILYNIGALHSELGARDSRQTDEEMKISCTHFQCAAWAFQSLIGDKKLFRSSDLSNDVLQFFVQMMLAQAQECILEKSMLDNRKSGIVAKVTAQVVEYYKSAMTMLQQGAMNTSSQSSIIEVVGSKLFKQWKKFVEFKLSYYDSICFLYMGNSSEEQQKMGERVAWYEAADSKIKQAAQLAQQLDEISAEITDAINFVTDVIAVKLANAKKENDFIYHEKIPPIGQLPEVKGISLVKGIPFNVCDPEVAGQDIFARLVPIEAHELASIYSARKDEILRDIRTKIEEKNRDLVSYLSLLQLEKDTLRAPKEDFIPDELINICAELSLHPDSVQEVEKTLKQLETVSHDTGKIIDESRELLKDEEKKEQEHQEKFGKRPPSLIVVELSKELSKHEETHKKAIESNRSLWENFEQHKDDILVMTSSSASKIASILPTNKNIKIDETTVAEMERLFDKIEEMKKQRIALEDQLSKEMNQDNVLQLVVAHPREKIEQIFDEEIKKYDKIVTLIEQNLNAQQNILNALTNCNAGYAETRKEIIEVQRSRKTRIASLLYTYQVFKELQVNSKKGLEFYQKFQSIVIRLNARIRGVSKVQDEERQQFMQAQASKIMMNSGGPSPVASTVRPPTMIGENSGYCFGSGSGSGQSLPTRPPPASSIPPSLNFANIPATGAKLKDYLPFMKNTNRSMVNANPARLPSQPQPPSAMMHTSVGGAGTHSFTPSAPPSLTPTPPNSMNPQLQVSMGAFMPGSASVPSNFSASAYGQQLNQPNGQSVIGSNLGPNVSVPASMMITPEYSAPLSYTQALSTQVTYSLPAANDSKLNLPASANNQSYYNNSRGVENFSPYPQHKQPISSVLPIEPHPQTNNLQQPYGYGFGQPGPLAQHPQMLHQQQYPRPEPTMVAPSNTTHDHSDLTKTMIPPTSFQQAQQNYYNPLVKPLTNPNVGIPPSQQSVPAATFPSVGGIGYGVRSSMPTSSMPAYQIPQPRYPSVDGNVSVPPPTPPPSSVIPTSGIYARPTPQPQPITNHQPYSGVGNGVVGGNYPNIQQPIATTLSNNGGYQQPNQQYNNHNPPISNYSPATSMQQVNGHQTNITNNTGNQQSNITTILEQESKRGWSVLTPTPASSTVITTTTINSTTNKSEPSTATATIATATITESTLPDILSTMLTINTTNSDSTDGKTNGHRQESTTGTNDRSNDDSSSTTSTNNIEPKDLLSQFDPLFA